MEGVQDLLKGWIISPGTCEDKLYLFNSEMRYLIQALDMTLGKRNNEVFTLQRYINEQQNQLASLNFQNMELKQQTQLLEYWNHPQSNQLVDNLNRELYQKLEQQTKQTLEYSNNALNLQVQMQQYKEESLSKLLAAKQEFDTLQQEAQQHRLMGQARSSVIQDLTQKLKEVEEKLYNQDDLKQQNDNLQDKVDYYTKDANTWRERCSKAQQDFKDISEQIEGLKAFASVNQANIASKMNQVLEEFQTFMNSKKDKEQFYIKKIRGYRQELQDFDKDIIKIRQLYQQMQVKFNNETNSMQIQTQENEKYKQQVVQLNRENEQLRNQIQDYSSELRIENKNLRQSLIRTNNLSRHVKSTQIRESRKIRQQLTVAQEQSHQFNKSLDINNKLLQKSSEENIAVVTQVKKQAKQIQNLTHDNIMAQTHLRTARKQAEKVQTVIKQMAQQQDNQANEIKQKNAIITKLKKDLSNASQVQTPESQVPQLETPQKPNCDFNYDNYLKSSPRNSMVKQGFSNHQKADSDLVLYDASSLNSHRTNKQQTQQITSNTETQTEFTQNDTRHYSNKIHKERGQIQQVNKDNLSQSTILKNIVKVLSNITSPIKSSTQLVGKKNKEQINFNNYLKSSQQKDDEEQSDLSLPDQNNIYEPPCTQKNLRYSVYNNMLIANKSRSQSFKSTSPPNNLKKGSDYQNNNRYAPNGHRSRVDNQSISNFSESPISNIKSNSCTNLSELQPTPKSIVKTYTKNINDHSQQDDELPITLSEGRLNHFNISQTKLNYPRSYSTYNSDLNRYVNQQYDLTQFSTKPVSSSKIKVSNYLSTGLLENNQNTLQQLRSTSGRKLHEIKSIRKNLQEEFSRQDSLEIYPKQQIFRRATTTGANNITTGKDGFLSRSEVQRNKARQQAKEALLIADRAIAQTSNNNQGWLYNRSYLNRGNYRQ